LNDQALGNAQEGLMELTVQLSFTDWESEVGKFTNQNESTARSILGTGAGLLGNLLS